MSTRTEAARLARNTAIVAAQIHAYRIERAAAEYRYAARSGVESHYVGKFITALLAISGVTSSRHGI